jgi:hypothetical protein
MDNVTIVWKLEDAGSVGGYPAAELGAPQIIREAGGGHVRFDGKVDGSMSRQRGPEQTRVEGSGVSAARISKLRRT